MQIFRELAGYSLGRADIVRRAMSKKKHDVMEKERHAFIYGDKNPDGTVACEGCVSRGISPKVAESIFDEMTAFSSYAFNKSHAAAYAYVAYQTAYLKCHYEKQYMSALLTSVLDDGVKLSKYIAECQKNGIKVLPPDVNRSNRGFTATEEGIRFGLLAVRNIGVNLVEKLIAERQNGEFSSVYDFCTRLYGNDLNRRAAESLIKCGAFDCFGNTRRQLLQGIEPLMKAVEGVKRYSAGGQMGLFDTAEETVVDIGYTLPECDEMPQFELLQGEKEVTGMYISGHPLYEYSAAMSEKGLVKTFDLLDAETNHKLDGKFVSMVVMASKLRRKQTKSNDTMAFLEVEDMYGSVNVLVFPKLYAEHQHLMNVGSVLKISGRVSVKESGEVDLVCSKMEQVKKGTVNETKRKIRKGLYLKLPSLDSDEYKKARRMMDIFKGDVPVIVKVNDIGKALVAPENRWVTVGESLLRDLEELLGQDNVKYVE